MAAVAVGAVEPERGDLEGIAVHHHDDRAELRSDGDGVGEHGLDRLGRGAGGDVVVLGGPPQEPVAHATAGEVGFVAGVPETPDDMEGLVLL